MFTVWESNRCPFIECSLNHVGCVDRWALCFWPRQRSQEKCALSDCHSVHSKIGAVRMPCSLEAGEPRSKKLRTSSVITEFPTQLAQQIAEGSSPPLTLCRQVALEEVQLYWNDQKWKKLCLKDNLWRGVEMTREILSQVLRGKACTP